MIQSFLELSENEWKRIKASEEYLSEHISEIVEDLYKEFMKDDGTAKFYLNEDGTIDTESYEHRIDGFEYWFERIFEANPEEEQFQEFLSNVGFIHTEDMGFEDMDVPFQYMIPTFSFLFNRISNILSKQIDDPEILSDTLEAWNRFLLLQLSLMHEARNNSFQASD